MPITLILSGAAGVTVSKKLGKYIFRDSAQKEILSVAIDDIPNSGLGQIDDVIEGGISSYAEFSQEASNIGMRTDLTNSQKIKELQKLFENSDYKVDILKETNWVWIKTN